MQKYSLIPLMLSAAMAAACGQLYAPSGELISSPSVSGQAISSSAVSLPEEASTASVKSGQDKKVYAKTVSTERLGSQVTKIEDVAIYQRSDSYRVYDVDFGWGVNTLYTGKVIALPEDSEKGYVIGKYDTDKMKGWGGAGYVSEDIFCWFYGNDIAFYDRDSFEVLDFPLEFHLPEQPEYHIQSVYRDTVSEEFVILYRTWTPMTEQRLNEVRHLPTRWAEQNSHLEIQRFDKNGGFIDRIDTGIICGEDVIISDASYNSGLLCFWERADGYYEDGEYFTCDFKTGKKASFKGNTLLISDGTTVINSFDRESERPAVLVTSTWLEGQTAYKAAARFDFVTRFDDTDQWEALKTDKQGRTLSARYANMIFDFDYDSGSGTADYLPQAEVFEKRPVHQSTDGRYEIYYVGHYGRASGEYACLDTASGEVYPLGELNYIGFTEKGYPVCDYPNGISIRALPDGREDTVISYSAALKSANERYGISNTNTLVDTVFDEEHQLVTLLMIKPAETDSTDAAQKDGDFRYLLAVYDTAGTLKSYISTDIPVEIRGIYGPQGYLEIRNGELYVNGNLVTAYSDAISYI